MAGLGAWGIARLPTSFIPVEDQGYVLVGAQLPDGAAAGRTQQVMDQVTKIALGVPGVDQVISISGISVLDNSATLANAGVAYVILKDWSLRKPGSGADLRSVYAQSAGCAGQAARTRSRWSLVPPPIQGIGNASGFTMQIELRDGSFDYAKLQTITQTMVRDGNTQTGLQRLNSTFRAGVPQLRVVVDRVKAETLNVSVGDVFNVLAGYVGSSYVNQFNKFGRTFQVYVQADSKFRLRPGDIEKLYVRSQDNKMVPLGALVHHTADGRAFAGRPLQSVSDGEHRRWTCARLQLGRGDGPHGADRRQDAAARGGLRMDRDVLPGEDCRQSDLLRVRPRHAAGLSVPGRPVRELDRAAYR